MNARKSIDALFEEDDLPLGAADPQDKEVTVTVNVKGEGAARFKEFMETVASCCNSGSSREMGVSTGKEINWEKWGSREKGEEKPIRWSFDGDGNTRITVT